MLECAVFVGYVSCGQKGEDEDRKIRDYLNELVKKEAISSFSGQTVIDDIDCFPHNLPDDSRLHGLLRIYLESAQLSMEQQKTVAYKAKIADVRRFDALTGDTYEKFKLEIVKCKE